MEKRNKMGSVGVIAPKPYCEVKIVEGEIFIRGSIVMKEYYNDKEATDDAFENGWFKTGDLGYVDDGFLFITGRKKNLIVLSDGNNISPEELEIPIEKIPLIKGVFVCGKKHNASTIITACIHPDYEYINEADISDSYSEIEREIAKINSTLPPHKRIQKIEIHEDDFEKTALGKVKRHMHM
jgi:long-chain acyl-CoA synthetase